MPSRVSAISPFALAADLWPDVYFDVDQKRIIRSLEHNKETVVPASNKRGKGFTAAFLCLYFFLTRCPCRIVTTSAGEDHLDVLWGEIGRFLQRARRKLLAKEGGILVVNDLHITKLKYPGGPKDEISYMKGMVASDENIAKMQGHHAEPDNLEDANDGIPRTLFVSDESSSVKDDYYRNASTWFQRALIIGNTWPCDNFFYRAIEGDIATGDPGGDLLRDPDDPAKGYDRKIIHLPAETSPNVRLGLAQRAAGIEPTNEVIVPGLTFEEYEFRRRRWDVARQTVSLDARFYKGAQLLLFPAAWLALSARRWAELRNKPREAKAVGVDTGEGSANTSMAAADERGIIEIESFRGSTTADIVGRVAAFAMRHGVLWENVLFDIGGGGREHADRMRAEGRMVRTIFFGDPPSKPPPDDARRIPTATRRRAVAEARYVYANRRAEMYGELSEACDPENGGYGLPSTGGPAPAELHRQLGKTPKNYTDQGKLILPPKNRGVNTPKHVKTMTQLIGCSPDEADAAALAYFGVQNPATIYEFGAIT
jgi:hypothetical protein